MSGFPLYTQPDAMDCGPTCLRMVAKYYGRNYSVQTLREKSFITSEGVSMLGISDAAENIGFRTTGVKLTLERLLVLYLSQKPIGIGKLKENDKIELRSKEFQEVLSDVPHWILRWGIIVLAVFAVILLIGSAIFKYPDAIAARVTLTGTEPPVAIVARSSGKIKELFVKDNQEVKPGDYLAVIDNPVNTEDISLLERFILPLKRILSESI